MNSPESSEPSWTPDETVIARSQLAQLMSATGFDNFDDLHRWSVSDPDAFWDGVINTLDIQFERPPVSTNAICVISVRIHALLVALFFRASFHTSLNIPATYPRRVGAHPTEGISRMGAI